MSIMRIATCISGKPTECKRWCVLRLSFREKVLGHSGHLNLICLDADLECRVGVCGEVAVRCCTDCIGCTAVSGVEEVIGEVEGEVVGR